MRCCQYGCLNHPQFLGSIWFPVCCVIMSSEVLIFWLTFFLDVLVLMIKSSIFAPWQWCSQSLDTQDSKFRILFIASWIRWSSFRTSMSTLSIIWTPIYFGDFSKSGEGIGNSHTTGQVDTFIDFFPLTGSTHRLPRFPTSTESPFELKTFWNFDG